MSMSHTTAMKQHEFLSLNDGRKHSFEYKPVHHRWMVATRLPSLPDDHRAAVSGKHFGNFTPEEHRVAIGEEHHSSFNSQLKTAGDLHRKRN